MTSTSTVKPRGQESMFVILLLTGLCSPSASDTNAYYFVPDKMSWNMARHYCVEHHTHLAEIHDSDNNTELKNTPTWDYHGKAWIGLRPDVQDWTWVDGTLPTYNRWERYSSDELCVYMTHNGTWRSADCSVKKFGVCNTSLIESPMKWIEAKALCEETGTSLVIINSYARNMQILDDLELAKMTDAWIGLYRPSVWYWANTGENASLTNWKKGQPDDLQDSGVCATVSAKDGTWSDESCVAQFPFYCYGEYQARKMVLQIKLQSSVNIEDPVLQTRLLQQLQAATHSQEAKDFKLTWTKTPKKETQGSTEMCAQ